MLKPALIFSMVFLISGCEDESLQKEAALKPVQELDKKLYAIKIPTPKPQPTAELPKIEEIPATTPVEFPLPIALIREEEAKILRGKRQQVFRASLQVKSSKMSRFRLQDEDYQQWEPLLPQDKSTLPVDRSRILTTDMRINAILEDNINSQIPGRVIAIVDRDVLSPNGQYILLPAYTKIICGYEGLDQTGETRLPIACTRALRPDGTSIVLTQAIASDQMGRTGLIGEVDTRTFERYGAAFIVSGISALAQSGVNQNQAPWLNNTANILSNNLGQVTAEVIKQNIDLRPIISIKAGSRIQIIPQTDIVLRKPSLKEQP
jgi:type IV secretion system protein VirB10